MKICPNCGQQMEEAAKFCENCGVSLVPTRPQFCSNCGQALAPDAAFCSNCGTSVREMMEPEPQAEVLSVQTDAAPGQELATVQPSVPAPQSGMFCTNCGERIPAGSTFCPNCNAIIQPQGGGADRKASFQFRKPEGVKLPDRRLLIAAVAVVVVIAAAALLPRLFSSPAKTFISVQEDLFLDPLLSAMETEMDTFGTGKFSTDLTVTASTDAAEIDRYLSDSSVVLKMDADKGTLLASGELTLMGSPVFSGSLTYDKGKLGVYLPELDDNYYVMDLASLLETAGLDSVNVTDVSMPEFSGKEWRSLADTYLDLAYTVVTKDNLEVKKGEEFRLPELGGSYKGTIYTFTPDREDIQATVEKLADHLENDKTLRSAILKLVSSQALRKSMGSYLGFSSLEDALDEGIQEAARNLREQAGSIGQQIEDSGFCWKLCMEGKELRMVTLETRRYDQLIAFEQEGTTSKKCTQVFYDGSYGDREIYFRNTYSKQGSTYDGEVYLSNGYSNDCTVRYKADTDKLSVFGIPYGSYELSADYGDLRCSMEVSGGKSGSTDHTITLRGDSYLFSRAFSRLDLTVNATDKSSVKKPSARTTDISSYSAWELSDLIGRLADQAESSLGSMFYGDW